MVPTVQEILRLKAWLSLTRNQTRDAEYKALDPRWHDWSAVESVLADLADRMTR